MRKVAEGEKVHLEEKVYATMTSDGTLIIEYITEGPLGQDRARCIGLSSIGAQALLDLLANGEAVEHSVQSDICPRCEGTGKYQRLGFAPTDCALCNGTGKCR